LPGLLLDTHALFWLVSGEDSLADQALVEIGSLSLQQSLRITHHGLGAFSRHPEAPTNRTTSPRQ
jgi:hypothetical protein